MTLTYEAKTHLLQRYILKHSDNGSRYVVVETSYLGDTLFDSLSRDRLSTLRFLVSFLSSSKQFLEQ
jgi:hypothetical protein